MPATPNGNMLKWLSILGGIGLFVLFIAFSLSYPRNLRSHGVDHGRFNLRLAYTNYLASGRVEPNGTTKPYLFTDAATVGGTQYQCVIAVETSYFQGDGFLAMTTNDQFIFFDKRRGPFVIPSTGYHRARLFPPGM